MYNRQRGIARPVRYRQGDLLKTNAARDLRLARRARSAPERAGDWQARVITRYRLYQWQAAARMRAELAARVLLLTGRVLAPGAIYANPDARLATGVVDGMVFRAHGDSVSLLRQCAYCGIGQFESHPLHDVRDVGYALAAWRPLCRHCLGTDPADWPHRDGEDLNGDP